MKLTNLKISAKLAVLVMISVIGFLAVAGFSLSEFHRTLIEDRRDKT